MKESFDKERLSRETMLPEIKILLDAAGLNDIDIRFLQNFHECGFKAFVHGSLLKSELRDVADIDFALVGNFSDIPSSIRNEFIPDISNEQLNSIDYFSIGKTSEAGRRMSLHVEKEEFRKLYPNNRKPFAREYRPTRNLKSSGKSRYLLSDFNHNGVLRIFRVECPQESLTHGVINTIPQTGIFYLGQKIMTVEAGQHLIVPVTHIACSLGMSPESVEIKNPEKTIVFGLEYDKMRTDRILYAGDPDETIAVSKANTIALANTFLGKNSQKYIDESSTLLEKYWLARKMP
jgi:hypothetical protein